jgi:hypothetical protein
VLLEVDRPTGQLTPVLMMRASVPVALRAQAAAAGLATRWG